MDSNLIVLTHILLWYYGKERFDWDEVGDRIWPNRRVNVKS
jgi:hypothetical protein